MLRARGNELARSCIAEISRLGSFHCVASRCRVNIARSPHSIRSQHRACVDLFTLPTPRLRVPGTAPSLPRHLAKMLHRTLQDVFNSSEKAYREMIKSNLSLLLNIEAGFDWDRLDASPDAAGRYHSGKCKGTGS